VLGVLALTVPAVDGLCPLGVLVLMPEDGTVLVTVLGVLARSVPGVGALCPAVDIMLGALVLTPGERVALVLGVLARSVPGVGTLCPEVTVGALVLMPGGVVSLCPGVEVRGMPEGTGSPCDEVATTLGELVLSPAGAVLETELGVVARGVPSLGVDVATTPGLTPVTGVPP